MDAHLPAAQTTRAITGRVMMKAQPRLDTRIESATVICPGIPHMRPPVAVRRSWSAGAASDYSIASRLIEFGHEYES